MKEVSLFCFVVMGSLKWDASDRVLGVFGKLLTRRVHGIGSTTFGPAVQFKVLEYWMIFSLKIKLNSS
jgi:hypothetical protein